MSLDRRAVVFCYPRTGVPDEEPPKGWNEIPGARGCTPQTCAFRDHYAEFRAFGVDVVGLSVQETDYQREMTTRLRVPFEVLSDAAYSMTDAMRLPTFLVENRRLLKRVTLVLGQGRVERVFYPVFPPDGSAVEVLSWLEREG